MRYYSTADRTHKVPLREAVLNGMPADGGLYMPESLPVMPDKFFRDLPEMTFQSLSFEVAKTLIGNDVPADILHKIIDDAINFETTLVNITEKIKTLELFHGPTLAFKDVGARFMSRLMAYFVRGSDRKLNILVATSGDTGSAVANGFFQIPGINVIVLYPAGKISLIQEKQIATMGGNVIALKVKGTFDDCQRLVKAALVDPDVQKALTVSSANSINIARLIPQTFYYFNAFRQIQDFHDKKIAVCVPSGNFGNLTAGLIAKKMGLPVDRFIAATNINHIVPDYLSTGIFHPQASIQTISNAMDVGNPSNFARMLALYDNSLDNMRRDIDGEYFTDDETRAAIAAVYREIGYILDPHGAVGYLGIKNYLDRNPSTDTGIFLETAHPAKFRDVVEPIIGTTIAIPDRLAKFLERKVLSINISSEYEEFKAFLLENKILY
ncbi:MAG: threonine synthase [Candidatus Neomarinimicrobiota bacterium]